MMEFFSFKWMFMIINLRHYLWGTFKGVIIEKREVVLPLLEKNWKKLSYSPYNFKRIGSPAFLQKNRNFWLKNLTSPSSPRPNYAPGPLYQAITCFLSILSRFQAGELLWAHLSSNLVSVDKLWISHRLWFVWTAKSTSISRPNRHWLVAVRDASRGRTWRREPVEDLMPKKIKAVAIKKVIVFC